MKTLEELNAMDKAALKAYGQEMDVEVKGNLSEETLIERIMAKQDEEKLRQARMNTADYKSQQPVLEEEPAEVKETKETKARGKEIEEVLKDHLEKGMTLEHDAVSWTLGYRGQIYSGNLSVPNDTIKRQADLMINRQ